MNQRVVFVNRLFWPDLSATSQLLTDLTLACAGQIDVHVLASTTPDSESTPGSLPGVSIHRLRIPLASGSGLATRALQFLWFHAAMGLWLLRHLRRGDVVVAMTDPPLSSVTAACVCRLRGARLVTWLQDLYPEVAMRLNVPLVSGVAGSLLQRLRDWSARVAARNVTIGSRMRDYLVERGIAPEKVEIISNWADERGVFPVPRAANPLRGELGFEGEFVVGYSGTLGRAHEFETLLSAAHLLAAHRDIVFVFFGGGYSLERLKARVESENLSDRFRFMPLQPRDRLAQSLSLPDVHWVSLRPELEDCIVPSKIYGIAAAGRPMIAVVGEDGELDRLAHDVSLCTTVQPGDGRAFAETILQFYRDPAASAEAGARARLLAETRFSKDASLTAWMKLLAEVAGRSPRSRG